MVAFLRSCHHSISCRRPKQIILILSDYVIHFLCHVLVEGSLEGEDFVMCTKVWKAVRACVLAPDELSAVFIYNCHNRSWDLLRIKRHFLTEKELLIGPWRCFVGLTTFSSLCCRISKPCHYNDRLLLLSHLINPSHCHWLCKTGTDKFFDDITM